MPGKSHNQIKYLSVFSLLGGYLLFQAFFAGSFAAILLLANSGIAFCGVGLAFGLGKPGFFLKKSGSLNLLGYLIYWPYYGFNLGVLLIYRGLTRENLLDEIVPGLYLGSKPIGPLDQDRITALGICGTLDLTSEFSESGFILKTQQYLNIPLLDTHPPSLEQLTQATSWIREQLQTGPVLVHCALGHGRSGTMVAAYLMATQKVDSAHEALKQIQAKRPKVGFHPGQFEVLNNFRR